MAWMAASIPDPEAASDLAASPDPGAASDLAASPDPGAASGLAASPDPGAVSDPEAAGPVSWDIFQSLLFPGFERNLFHSLPPSHAPRPTITMHTQNTAQRPLIPRLILAIR